MDESETVLSAFE